METDKKKKMYGEAILDFRYNHVSRILTIVFFSLGTYNYSNVPYDTYDDLLQSRDKGRFYNEKIKGKFPVDKKM